MRFRPILLPLMLLLFSPASAYGEVDTGTHINQDCPDPFGCTGEPDTKMHSGLTEMRWNNWESRLNDGIKEQFERDATAALRKTDERFYVAIRYVVTDKAEIKDAVFDTKSSNAVCNRLAMQTVYSLSGNKQLLTFPPAVPLEKAVGLLTILRYPKPSVPDFSYLH
jgi:hypothetical protein